MSISPKPFNHGKKQRWYEQDPLLKQSIELLQAFPDEILTIVAEGVNQIAEDEFKAEELIRSYKSIGQEKILALYKSKNKKRSYDKNPTMHKTVNYILLISEENRTILAKKIIELVSVVRDYFQICKESQNRPVSTQVKSLRDDYIAKGLKAAQEKLKQIRQSFMQNIQSTNNGYISVKETRANAAKHDEKLRTNLDEQDDGLRINFSKMNLAP